VSGNSSESVPERYADILGEQPEERATSIVDSLDAGYHSLRAPHALRAWRPTLHDATTEATPADTPSRPGATRRRYARVGPIALLLAALITGVALAATQITNLGKPVNITSTNSYFPLSGFHRMSSALSKAQPRKAALTFIGTNSSPANSPFQDPWSAAERWPVVKALSQFGTLTKVVPLTQNCSPDPRVRHSVCNTPTFNWIRARYKSKYIAFAHADLLDINNHCLQPLTSAELALYDRYVHPHSSLHKPKGDCYDAFHLLLTHYSSGTHQFPLLAVGGYVQTVSQVIVPGDLNETLVGPVTPGTTYSMSLGSGLPFNIVQQDLIADRDPPNTHLVEDVNGEANIIIALICHADGKKPASVCNRTVIKAILKHVK
jgi:hypothetical protein